MKESENKKSVGVARLTLLPLATGLALGLINGFTSMSSSKVQNSPFVGGTPDRLEMIGRSTATSTNQIVSQAVAHAKRNVTNGLKYIDSGHFDKMLNTPGPQRNAVMAAYRTILNSPHLGLSEEDIVNETTEILTASETKSNQEFVDEIRNRIKKKMIEFGSERQEEFLSDFSREFKNQLKVEKYAVQTEAPVNLMPQRINTVSINPFDLQKNTSAQAGRARSNLLDLQKMLSEQQLKHKLDIFQVTDNKIGTTAYMARVQVGSSAFDVPLAAGRSFTGATSNISLENEALGGFIFRGYKKKTGEIAYSSAAAAGSYLTSFNSTPVDVENFFMGTLKNLIPSIKKAHYFQGREIEQQFYDATFNQSQIIAPTFNKAQRANLVLSLFRVFNKIPGFKPGDRAHETLLSRNTSVKPIDVGYSQLSTGERFQSNAPTIETTFPFYRPGDLEIKAKSSSLRKTNAIIEENRTINPLGWTNRSNIIFRPKDNLQNEILGLNQEARTNKLVFYQFDEDNYLKRFNLDSGAYLGRSFSYRTNPSSIKDISTRDNTQLLDYILKNADPSTGEVFLTKKQVSEMGSTLGRHVSGTAAFLPIDSHSRGVRFTVRNSKHEDAISLSYEMVRAPQSFSKVRSLSLKGQVMKIAKGALRKEAGRTLGLNEKALTSLFGQTEDLIISDTDQIFREKIAMKNQMLTSFYDMVSRKKGKDYTQNLITSFSSWLKGSNADNDEIAKRIIDEMKKAGISDKNISNVVSGQVRLSVASKGTDYSYFLSDPQDALANVIRNAKGFYGIDTLSLDTGAELQGAGRMASIERRTIHGMIQGLKSSGVDDEETKKIVANILSRTGYRRNWQNALTSQTFLTSAMSFEGAIDTTDLERLSVSFSNGFSKVNRKFSDMPFMKKGKYDDVDPFQWLKDSSVFELEFDTPQSKQAARNVFGKESILLPGIKGSPALSRIISKKNGVKTNIGSEYEKIVRRIVKMSGDPNNPNNNPASAEQLEQEFRKLRAVVSAISAESSMSLVTGKVSGSVAARAWTLNSMESNDPSFKVMSNLAKGDKGLSVFASDSAFFQVISSQRRFLKDTGQAKTKAESELIDKISMFYFSNKKPIEKGGGIFGFFGRHPSLGEGHAGIGVLRRFMGDKENSQLLDHGFVKDFLKKSFGKEDHETLTEFLSGKIGVDKRREFSSLMYKNSSRLSKSGDSTFRVPIYNVNVALNGNKNPTLMSFSRLTNMIGDVDGDLVSFILHDAAIKPVKESVMGQAPINFFKSNIEFLSLKNHIKRHQDLKVSGQSMGFAQLLVEDVMKMVHSKNVQKFSTALDALKVATLSKGADQEKNRVAMQALVLIEEMMLKAKKQKVALDIADRVAESVFKGDKDNFMSLMREHIFGDKANISLDYDLKDYGMGELKYNIDYDSTLEYVWQNYSTLKNEGGLDLRNIKQVVNTLNFSELDDKTFRNVSGMLQNLHQGRGGLLQGNLAESAGVASKETLARISTKMSNSFLGNIQELVSSSAFRKIGAPIALGAAGTLLLNGLFSGGSDNNEQLIDIENANPATNNSLSLRDHFIPVENSKEYQFVDRNNIIRNETYLEEGNQSVVQSTVEGISNMAPVKTMINNLGVRTNHVYIQDNRPPITKNYIDRLKEY